MPPGPPPSFERERRKLAAQFDLDRDRRLNRDERAAAQKYLADERAHAKPGQRHMGPPPMAGGGSFAQRPAPQEGAAVSLSASVARAEPVYDPSTVRTLFLEFADQDWEKQLSDFYDTDIEVPATLRVDGQALPDVGVRFRGMSSFMAVPNGYKHSLNITLDAVHKDQNWLHTRTLNLLNSHEDPTYLRSVLYLEIARHYLPAAKANHVQLVINGHSWGAYVNVQQFNADFVEEWFHTRKGARFKVPGSPMGRGGLEYLGDDNTAYRHIYQLKTKDSPHVWADLIRLCKTLNQVPIDQLEAAVLPLLDLEGTLRFLALENVFINGDGYWVRASDYNLYQDEQGQFHIIPYDTNETFMAPPHMPGVAQAAGASLDPWVGLDDQSKPLRARLLQVPTLRTRYLKLVQEIATDWLDWQQLGPRVAAYQARIADLVRTDTRKLDSFEDFAGGIESNTVQPGPCGDELRIGLHPFVTQRRTHLLQTLSAGR